jgi:hypothetical protein
VRLTEEIKQDKSEPLPEEKKDDLFFAMLNGNTVEDTITTSRGDFVVKFPKQSDLITIARLAAFMRAGIPAGNFDSSGEYEIQKCATLDVIVDTGPAWFNKAKKAPNFSWRNMPDASFVDEVYAKALSFRQKVQAELRGIEGVADNGTPEEEAEAVPADVGGGVFSGIKNRIKRGGSKPTGDSV